MAKNKMKIVKKPKYIDAQLNIVIPVYGRFDLLEKCLDAIPASISTAYRVILVDNASPDKLEATRFYETYKDKYSSLVVNHENRGFPFACNRGAKEGTSPLILFLNSDIILEPGSLDKLIRGLDDPKVGIAGMLLVFPEYAGSLRPDIRPAGKVQHVGLEMNQQGQFIHMYVGWSADNPKVLSRHDSYAVTGAALLIRRELFVRAKMFDLEFGLGTFEDVSLCLTVRDMGYNVIVVPEARAIHYTGATAEYYKKGYPMQDNWQKLMMKWQNKLNVTSWMYH